MSDGGVSFGVGLVFGIIMGLWFCYGVDTPTGDNSFIINNIIPEEGLCGYSYEVNMLNIQYIDSCDKYNINDTLFVINKEN